jgi:hypothetical protein
MAQLIWYIAQTKDTGKVKKLVESYDVYTGNWGWVSESGPVYLGEVYQHLRFHVEEWAGLQLLHEDGPYWIPFLPATAVPLVASLRPPKWRAAGRDVPPAGIDVELWRNRSFSLDEVKTWRDGFLSAKKKPHPRARA